MGLRRTRDNMFILSMAHGSLGRIALSRADSCRYEGRNLFDLYGIALPQVNNIQSNAAPYAPTVLVGSKEGGQILLLFENICPAAELALAVEPKFRFEILLELIYEGSIPELRGTDRLVSFAKGFDFVDCRDGYAQRKKKEALAYFKKLIYNVSILTGQKNRIESREDTVWRAADACAYLSGADILYKEPTSEKDMKVTGSDPKTAMIYDAEFCSMLILSMAICARNNRRPIEFCVDYLENCFMLSLGINSSKCLRCDGVKTVLEALKQSGKIGFRCLICKDSLLCEAIPYYAEIGIYGVKRPLPSFDYKDDYTVISAE